MYVQGVFSDELATIVRIDKEMNMVKVRRNSDGTTKWVNVNDVISREQSQANDVMRGATGVALFICIINPDACRNN